MFNSREIIQKPNSGQNLTFQSAPVTMKIRTRSPKFNQLFPTMYLCKFGQSTFTCSEDNAGKPYFGHFKVAL